MKYQQFADKVENMAVGSTFVEPGQSRVQYSHPSDSEWVIVDTRYASHASPDILTITLADDEYTLEIMSDAAGSDEFDGYFEFIDALNDALWGVMA